MSYIEERRLEERDRRRGEIVAAAVELYAEMGWDSVTMDRVARRARLSRALLYVYFRDKSDLHVAIVEQAFEILRGRFELARAGRASGLAEVESIGRAYVAMSRELPHYFDACVRFEAQAFPGGEQPPNVIACLEGGHRVHEVIVDALHRGVADGSIRGDLGDPYVTALALWSFTHGLIQIAATKGWQIQHQGVPVEHFFDQAFALLLRSLRP